MSKSKINPKGSSWDELEKQLFTSEEIAESEVRVAIINEMIKAREENGITQKQLEAMIVYAVIIFIAVCIGMAISVYAFGTGSKRAKIL